MALFITHLVTFVIIIHLMYPGITSDGTAAAVGGASNLPIGNITVNPLSDLIRLCDVKSDTVNVNVMRDLQLLDRLSDRNTPDFTDNSKIFELDSSSDVGHVCLVYLDGREPVECVAANRSNVHPREENSSASIWLLDTTYRWHKLAPNFSNYFRKALVHMGLPHWQLKFTDMGLTSIGEVSNCKLLSCYKHLHDKLNLKKKQLS